MYSAPDAETTPGFERLKTAFEHLDLPFTVERLVDDDIETILRDNLKNHPAVLVPVNWPKKHCVVVTQLNQKG